MDRRGGRLSGLLVSSGSLEKGPESKDEKTGRLVPQLQKKISK
jgi:hypothetical protein